MVKNNETCTACKNQNYILYEDNLVIAFLEQNALTRGHTLIISKDHYVSIFETPSEVLEAMGKTAKVISTSLKEKLGCHNLNIIHASGEIAGQTVSHLHIHIVPRYPDDGIEWFKSTSHDTHPLEDIYSTLTS